MAQRKSGVPGLLQCGTWSLPEGTCMLGTLGMPGTHGHTRAHRRLAHGPMSVRAAQHRLRNYQPDGLNFQEKR